MLHDWICLADAPHIHFPFKSNEDRLLEGHNRETNGVLCTEVLINNGACPRLHSDAGWATHHIASQSWVSLWCCMIHDTGVGSISHFGLFYVFGWFYITSGCEAPVSTFTTIIPFISIKVSITGQRLDQTNGPWWWWNTVRSHSEKTTESEGKDGRCDSRAMRLQSWLKVGFGDYGNLHRRLSARTHKHTC